MIRVDNITIIYEFCCVFRNKNHASIIVERDSQKAIIIGHKGERLKQVGTIARGEIEKKLKARIFLGLHVKVMANWQSDSKALLKLGFTR